MLLTRSPDHDDGEAESIPRLALAAFHTNTGFYIPGGSSFRKRRRLDLDEPLRRTASATGTPSSTRSRAACSSTGDAGDRPGRIPWRRRRRQFRVVRRR